MIKSKQKPLSEIIESLTGYGRILTVGCGGCASVCLAGGLKEVQALNLDLNYYFNKNKTGQSAEPFMVERMCNPVFVESLSGVVETYDCILSMACGAGTQFAAEHFQHIPTFPAVNTMSIGVDRAIGLYEERCRACGECVIGYTGGICPVTNCAKGLFNGPCGGTRDGICEIGDDVPCAWQEIYSRLKKQNRLDHIMRVRPVMEWENQTRRLTVQPAYEKRFK